MEKTSKICPQCGYDLIRVSGKIASESMETIEKAIGRVAIICKECGYKYTIGEK